MNRPALPGVAPGYRETHLDEAALNETRSDKAAIGVYLTCDGPKGALNYFVLESGQDGFRHHTRLLEHTS